MKGVIGIGQLEMGTGYAGMRRLHWQRHRDVENLALFKNREDGSLW